MPPPGAVVPGAHCTVPCRFEVTTKGPIHRFGMKRHLLTWGGGRARLQMRRCPPGCTPLGGLAEDGWQWWPWAWPGATWHRLEQNQSPARVGMGSWGSRSQLSRPPSTLASPDAWDPTQWDCLLPALLPLQSKGQSLPGPGPSKECPPHPVFLRFTEKENALGLVLGPLFTCSQIS